MPPRKVKASSSTEAVGKGRTRKSVINYEESPGSSEFSDSDKESSAKKRKKPKQASAAGKGKKRKAAVNYKESPASSEISAGDSDKGSSGQKKKKSRQTDVVARGKKRKAAVNYEESPASSEISAEDSDKESSGQKKKRSKQTDIKITKKKAKESKAKPTKSRSKIPDVSMLNFSNEAKSPDGTPWNMKISSWNVNGVRAWLEKDGLTYLHHEQPDIFCIQETKCPDKNLPEEVKDIDGYHCYWLSGDKDGYSGVGLLSKEKPIDVSYGIGMSKHDKEGRAITAEYDEFFLVTSYVPNAGKGLVRLDYRMDWDKDFRKYLKDLESKKPVILCGDLNVAHEEIDLANPKTNKRNAGFTQEERDGFSSLLNEGFIDSFRELYPDEKGAYTFWTYMMNARAKNVGWRLDYFVISKSLLPKLCDSVIRKDVHGSDHCPVALFLAF